MPPCCACITRSPGIEMEWHAPIPQDMVELIEAMRADFETHKDDIDWL
ncbi:23S rRNA pseudouridine synthase D [Klebsiella pneumoniae subsp. ozaenae]|uniref:23S rRNA pseudouridine synthase D n=1 Tax=Klebsiella pneumoniae subsp. ozaenae TaxID=574 RepID=A0A377Z874_KLEPO|nr:23S rRNA pseudouridine synthase D [Klebsiella pneumoniae subsp. ozaenae]